MRFLVGVCLLPLFLTSHVWAEARENPVLLSARENYIIPAYQHLAKTTDRLSEEIADLCDMPSSAQLNDAKAAFHQTVAAWSSIEWFRIGPVLQNNRVERFFFFPDRKSRGLRQVRLALTKQEQDVLDLEELQTMSVALQGLGALDFILFGTDSETLATGNTFRCQFASTISKNLDHIATALVTAWKHDTSLRMNWTIPSHSNSFFLTEKEAMNALIGTLIHGLEAIRDTRINMFLRENPQRDRPESAALWRSGATMRSIAANLEGLEKLFTQSQIETILPREAHYLGDTIRFEFEQSIETAKALDAPVASLLSSPDQREKLEYLKLTLGFLIDRLNTEFAPAAGLAAGFSFGDGD